MPYLPAWHSLPSGVAMRSGSPDRLTNRSRVRSLLSKLRSKRDLDQAMTDSSNLMPADVRLVHRTLLDSMVTKGELPSPTELADQLGLSEAALATLLDVLIQADYLGRDDAGLVSCLYPFSSVPTPHTVVLDSARRFAMCSRSTCLARRQCCAKWSRSKGHAQSAPLPSGSR